MRASVWAPCRSIHKAALVRTNVNATTNSMKASAKMTVAASPFLAKVAASQAKSAHVFPSSSIIPAAKMESKYANLPSWAVAAYGAIANLSCPPKRAAKNSVKMDSITTVTAKPTSEILNAKTSAIPGKSSPASETKTKHSKASVSANKVFDTVERTRRGALAKDNNSHNKKSVTDKTTTVTEKSMS